jgi:tetratricopeptide (TPR) repeat protein
MRPIPRLWAGNAGNSSSSIPALATFVKDYWFLITVLLSAAASVFYMVVFRVTPLDKYYEIRDRRERVQFHDSSGKTLLEYGYFAQAKTEFQIALDLEPVDEEATNGRYLSDLFLQFEKPDWDPQIGFLTQQELRRSRVWKKQEFRHIVEKYWGEVASRTFDPQAAKQHYEAALKLKPDYVDALLDYGWFNYFDVYDVSSMKALFQKATKLAPYDYRGFHGLGYALYIQAITAQDPKQRSQLQEDATVQSARASKLGITQLSVLVDLGEVARTTDPSLSVWYHQFAQEIADDPKLANLPDIAGTIGGRLLASDAERTFRLKNSVQKRAWITYQLALDHLALCDLGTDSRANQAEHDRLMDQARKLDAGTTVLPGEATLLDIYNDQSKILQKLIPGVACAAYH